MEVFHGIICKHKFNSLETIDMESKSPNQQHLFFGTRNIVFFFWMMLPLYTFHFSPSICRFHLFTLISKIIINSTLSDECHQNIAFRAYNAISALEQFNKDCSRLGISRALQLWRRVHTLIKIANLIRFIKQTNDRTDEWMAKNVYIFSMNSRRTKF